MSVLPFLDEQHAYLCRESSAQNLQKLARAPKHFLRVVSAKAFMFSRTPLSNSFEFCAVSNVCSLVFFHQWEARDMEHFAVTWVWEPFLSTQAFSLTGPFGAFAFKQLFDKGTQPSALN